MNVAPRLGLPYYGWFVLAASALSEMLAIGATSYTAGFFVLPLQAEFGLSRANASMPVLLIYLGAVFAAPYAGRLIDRYPVRLVISCGALVFSGALAAIAISDSLWFMALLLLLPAAGGFMLFGPIATATLASRWFYRRRGLAQGVAALALSGGGFIVVPLLSKAIHNYGWRTALLGEAVAIFVIVTALAMLLVKDNPFRAGLAEHPENKGRSDAALFLSPGGRDHEDATPNFRHWRQILGKRGFWAPSLVIAATSGICEAIVIAVPPYGSQLGLAAAGSALLITAFTAATAVAKILAGAMADFWSARVLLFTAVACMPLSLAILFLFSGYPALFAACCFAGIALGGVMPTAASLLAARFGAARFGSVMGWTYALIGAFAIAAVRFAGSVFDKTGVYRPAFAGLLAFSLAVVAFAFVMDFRASDRAES